MKKLLFMLVIVSCLISLLPIPVSAQSIVDDAIEGATWGNYPHRRATFYADGRYWTVYGHSGSGGNIYYKSSLTGESGSWTARQTLSTTPTGGRFVSVWFDGTYAYYVFWETTLRYGMVKPNGTTGALDWEGRVEQNTGFVGSSSGGATIAVDTNSFPWIAYSDNQDVYVAKSSTSNGTWTTDFNTLIADGSGLWVFYVNPTILPLTAGKMAALYSFYSGGTHFHQLHLREYNGGWNTQRSSFTDVGLYVYAYPYSGGGYQATVQGDTVHIVAKQAASIGDIYYFKWQSNIFSGAVLLADLANDDQSPTISRDTTTNNLHVLWADHPTEDRIYYKRYVSTLSAWSDTYELLSETLPSQSYYLNTDPIPTEATLGLYYAAGTGTTLKFKSITEPFEVSTLYADGINDVYATLYGEIESLSYGNALTRGFIYKAGSDPIGGGATTLSESGSFSTGTYQLTTLPILTPSTLYHFRAFATNSFGTVYGEDEQFYTGAVPTPTPAGTPTPAPTMPPGSACTTAPDITTKAATNVSMTTARLNAFLNDDGGGETYVKFQYTTGAFPGTETSWVGGYWDGNPNAYVDVTGLTGNTTYTFRAMAVNPCGNDTGGNLTFTTAVSLASVTTFKAIPRADYPTIDLQWITPAGASSVMIRYKLGEYPGNSTDGILAGNVTGTSYQHENLTPGATLWYAAWGVSGNNTSTSPAYAIATVSLVTTEPDSTAPDEPMNWFVDVDYTHLSGVPFYGTINTVIDDFGFSREFFWAALGFMMALLVFIAAYRASQGNLFIAGLSAVVIMAIEVPMGLMAGFLVFLFSFLFISIKVISSKA